MKETKIHSLPSLTVKEILVLASEAEKREDTERAIELYEKAIQKKPLDETPHKRLMIIHRRNKDKKSEMKIVDRAISLWRNHLKSLQDGMHAGNPAKAKIKRLSASIEKKLAAKHVEPEPIAGWLKRKQLLSNKKSVRQK